MPTPILSEHRHSSRRKRSFGALYAALILLSFHWAIVLYINSSYLEQYVSSASIGLLYTVSSAIAILSFLFISKVLHKAGNYLLTLVFTLIEFMALIGMALSESLRVAIPLFIVHQAVVPLILFNLDIFMEEMIGNKEEGTGGKRGLYLVLMSLAGSLSALVMGYLVGDGTPNFTAAYVGSACLLIPFILIIMRYFKTFEDPAYSALDILNALRNFWIHKNVRNVFLAHFLLQLFFSWMVIYTPLYLATKIGFNWEQIGQILFVGLLAYVIFEYPVGQLADKKFGEKEMMAIGFVIIGLSTAWFTFITSTSMILWMFVMFLTRVGASLVETTTESYFFKHTNGSDSNVISFFRITRPLSIVIGALLGSLTLLYLEFNQIFLVLGLLMIPGIFFTLLLKDTK